MSALMADHSDYADDARQPSLFDVLAPPSARPRPEDAEQPEGGRVVEFPRRPEVPAQPGTPDADASSQSVAEAPSGNAAVVDDEPLSTPAGYAESVPAADESTATAGYLEPAPAVAPEDDWLTEIAPDLDDAELALLAPAETEFAPGVDVTGEPRTQRAAGSPLAGPTLDDVVSRVWEGLVMRLPAACPVCQGEVLPALPGTRGGSCTSCGTSID